MFIPQRVDIQLSVIKWEKLLSTILKSNQTLNTSNLDVNEDGNIDIKDLCILYSKFSEGNKDPGKKQVKILEAIVNRELNTKLYYSTFVSPFLSNVEPVNLWTCFENRREINYIYLPKVDEGSISIFPLRC